MTPLFVLQQLVNAISTHTLTWSVTGYFYVLTLGSDYISTHTLTWSVTVFSKILLDVPSISTHTLTWSVTGKPCAVSKNVEFQLTRSRGA